MKETTKNETELNILKTTLYCLLELRPEILIAIFFYLIEINNTHAMEGPFAFHFSNHIPRLFCLIKHQNPILVLIARVSSSSSCMTLINLLYKLSAPVPL